MNRGINRQEARLGRTMTDLQCVHMCVCSFSTSGLPSGESGSAEKETPCWTHWNKNTHSQIYMKRFYKAQNHYGNEKWKGLKILVYSSLCFGRTLERPLADNERGKEWDGDSKRNSFSSHQLFLEHLPSQPQISSYQHSSAFKREKLDRVQLVQIRCMFMFLPKKDASVTCWLTAKSEREMAREKEASDATNRCYISYGEGTTQHEQEKRANMELEENMTRLVPMLVCARVETGWNLSGKKKWITEESDEQKGGMDESLWNVVLSYRCVCLSGVMGGKWRKKRWGRYN